MLDIAIKVENVSKLYRLGNSGSFKDLFNAKMGRLFNKEIKAIQDFWALDDLSFEIKKGEAVGIIGKNGAGKSTLLKILSRITEPTKGRIILDGKVSSLLEVGTGFHPELSGRENIFLNGSILGMKRGEIRDKFDEIVNFSGIEKFIDTPVKRYSSGMYVRLAFAVAAHLEPEILIIDEVLAVGDLDFQKKCLGKMKDSVTNGRTVLFVSHNMQAINSLTSKCLFLEKGKVAFSGKTSEVISEYVKKNAGDLPKAKYVNDALIKPANYIEQVEIHTSDSNGIHYWGDTVTFNFIFYLQNISQDTGFSFQIVNNENIAVCHFSPPEVSLKMAKSIGENRYEITCVIPKFRLFMGQYRLVTWLADNKSKSLLENLESICEFEVSMLKKPRENYEWKSTDCIYLEDYFFE